MTTRIKYLTLLTLLFVVQTTYSNSVSLDDYIRSTPKAHLSLHIEGTLSPRLYWRLAHKHHLTIPYRSLHEVEKRISDLSRLDDFLALDHEHIKVLQDRDDFYDLTYDMLEKQFDQGVTHLEFQFNPENHTNRGVPLSSVIAGLDTAIQDFQKKHVMSVLIIASFLKEQDAKSIIQSYDRLIKASQNYPHFQKKWVAVGLDSNEKNNYPSKFYPFMKYATQKGHKIVPHAGHDEAATPYISDYLTSCESVNRIDHGNMAAFDKNVLRQLKKCHIPVALCPISEIKIGPMKDVSTYPLKIFIQNDIGISINSDDPAYLNANLIDNYLALAKAQHLDNRTLKTLFINSFKGSLLPQKQKAYWIDKINQST